MKRCTRCKRTLPLAEFRLIRQTERGCSWCKRCECDAATQWARANPERRKAYLRQWWKANAQNQRIYRRRNAQAIARRARAWGLRVKFQLSEEHYVALLKKQGGCCAICRGPETEQKTRYKKLCIDHDHSTGQVRGLLCQSCNKLLGVLERIPDWFERACAYLSLAHDLASVDEVRDVNPRNTAQPN